MIDLRFAQLPSAIEVDGELFALKTDFRTWIEFLRGCEEDGIASYEIFDGPVPSGDSWVAAAMEFANSENETPHGRSTGAQDNSFDFVLDGDYIVGSFQQAYGIDLTDPGLDMHWHRFLALFRSLPEDTKMAEIMGYRCWNKTQAKRKPESKMDEAKKRWSLPQRKTKANEAVVEWAEKAFGNIKYP